MTRFHTACLASIAAAIAVFVPTGSALADTQATRSQARVAAGVSSSPPGSILVSSSRGGVNDLVYDAVDADGGGLKELWRTDLWEPASWTPDGRSLHVGPSILGADGKLHLVGLHGDRVARQPVWSPDGRELAYVLPGDPDALRVLDARRHRVVTVATAESATVTGLAGRLPPRAGGARGCELPLHLVDQLLVEVEVPAQELDHDQEVLLAVREGRGGLLSLVEPVAKVGEIRTERDEALAGRLLADEVRDQKPKQRLALERRERDGRPRVRAQRVEPLFREPVDGSLSRPAGRLPGLEVPEPGEPLRLRVVLALSSPVEHAPAPGQPQEVVRAGALAPDEAEDLVREQAQVTA